MDAIILAAGRGTRMQSLTDDTPKPLLLAAGRPLIAYQIDALVAAGATRIVINVAYLSDQFRAQLGDGAQFGTKLRYSQEPQEALETAGGIGLMLQRKLVRSDPFVVANGDVFSDFDYTRLAMDPGDTTQLVMVDNPAFHPNGDFYFDQGRLVEPNDQHALSKKPQRLTFSGIGLYRQSLFADLITKTQRFKLAPLLRDAILANQAGGLHHKGYWTSVDTPERLAALSADLTVR